MPDSIPDAPEDDLIVGAVFTPEGALRLLERVGALESHVPATVPDDTPEVTLEDITARLNRHREDLESIKAWLVGLSQFLGLPAPKMTTDAPATPAPTQGSYQ